MQLLVSVSNAAEAAAAVAGGADLVDAKDPRAGPLGAVTAATFDEIVHAVGGARPVTAALGDASQPAMLQGTAGTFAASGARFVKVGFAGVAGEEQIARLLTAALAACSRVPRNGRPPGWPTRRPSQPWCMDEGRDFNDPREGATGGAGTQPGRAACGVIAVAYADSRRAATLPIERLLCVAVQAGVGGLLIDTFDKDGPGLRALVAHETLRSYVDTAHGAGLLVALAGRLTADDLPFVQAAGADIAGTRGAACGGDRAGRIDAGQVRLLRARCGLPAQPVTAGCSRPSPDHGRSRGE